jgi:hypothetical protein
VTHKNGHSKANSYTVRIGNGPPGSSESQSDGAAHSYAKRGALCDAFGIIIEADTDGVTDARVEGHPITQAQADELRDWLEQVGGDKEKFLQFAKVERFEDVMSANLPTLHEALRKRQAEKAK